MKTIKEARLAGGVLRLVRYPTSDEAYHGEAGDFYIESKYKGKKAWVNICETPYECVARYLFSQLKVWK